MPAAALVVRLMRRVGLDDIESEAYAAASALPRQLLSAMAIPSMPGRTRALAVPGCIYAVAGRKRGSNVIAIPIHRDQRPALIMALKACAVQADRDVVVAYTDEFSPQSRSGCLGCRVDVSRPGTEVGGLSPTPPTTGWN